ncbi:hypothetical protein [Methanocorpusculum vombati]|uniref:Ribbon-helix-helix protein CopG domain-containing protein n=1 Tax=Methanocorpusculum vombati TaxID=3002864 RepID=A0ABT4IKL2_9EURY|nr:hypothetical protein [Methanocorpusculum vombati]MCZ9319588.1 hypothetical protein [Methanocorpusculum sp.]MCZ0862277.1 hypothetical protein [Methanocorpusculum vombati]MDE2534463.1 hypothetical protein [Methanocorpusculum sp.]MDE2545773.1 hypothetical protein [Methanocorpusculum sp.]MDE2547814.1 hypothetical protein [Methanocorpusculum sp.]
MTNALRIGVRVPYPQASQVETLAKQRGISTAMTARILITKALEAGITV